MLDVVFGSVDALLAFAPLWARLCIWGGIFGAGTMLAYALLSDQERIGAIKERVDQARAELQAYDGTDLDELGRRTRRALRLSVHQLKVMLAPTVAAGLPILAGLIWMEDAYTYRLPDPGTDVVVEATPAGGHDPEAWRWEPDSALADTSGTTATIRWPGGPDDDRVRLVAASDGETLVSLPPSHARPTISQPSWTHWLYANPAGYLPADGPVASVHLELPYRTVVRFGPTWLRTWHLFFLTVLTVAAFVVKVAFGID